MSEMYNLIESLAKQKGVNITQMCRDSGASRGSLSDLKSGKTDTLHPTTLSKLADYFGVTVDYLLGQEKSSAEDAEHDILDDIDVGFYGDFRVLDETDKDMLRDMVRRLRAMKEAERAKR